MYRTYAAANLPLFLGKNTIQAAGHDRAGNGTTTSITITRVLPSQPPAPTIGDGVITYSLSLISGNNQSGTIGGQLAAPLVVALKDSSNNPVANQSVVFKVTGGNGTLINGGATGTAVALNTNASGQAQVSWKLGDRSGAGINKVEASSALAFGTGNFTATALTATVSQIVLDSGNNQTGVLGQPLAFPFVVITTDSGFNRVAGVPVTFTVKQGGGNIDGAPTKTVTTDSNGRAIAVLTVGLQQGIQNSVEANFGGNSGSPVTFTATPKSPGNPANTTISGVVLDNSNNTIQGVTMRLFQTNQGNNNNLPVQIGTPVQTNTQGTFQIPSAPVGFFKLMADGGTVPGSKKYPTLEYDIVTVAGIDNTVGMPIYLPALDAVNKLCVDETHGGTLKLPQYPGFALTVLPGSATFPGGSHQGCVSVTPVNGDKVPMSPGFGQQPRFIVTIQPVGTTFNPPAPITLPNVDGLKPKAVTEMYSYDHDLSMFVAIGTGTVSDDGSKIVSSPGVGVLKAGWHCGGNPNQTGGGQNASISLVRQSLTSVVATGAPTPIGNPAYSYQSQAISGSSVATVGYAPGVTSQTHPNTAVLTAPANPSPTGAPSPGGLAQITATYKCDSGQTAQKSFKVATFGLSCYLIANENDSWDGQQCTSIKISGVTYSGTTTLTANNNGIDGTFCTAFLAEVRLEGSGVSRTGLKIQYVTPQLFGPIGDSDFETVTVFNGADLTPVVAGQTVARDRNIIPTGGVLVDLDGIGSGLLANDTGGKIIGYRIDVFGGAGRRVCDQYPNDIVIGACNPGNSKCPASSIP